MLQMSTGAKALLLGNKSLEDIFKNGVIKIFTGVPPSTADDAETGTLLVTITNNGETEEAKQRTIISIGAPSSSTPESYTVTIDGEDAVFVPNSGFTAVDVKNGLSKIINAMSGFTPFSCNSTQSSMISSKLKNRVKSYIENGNLVIEALNPNDKFDVTVSSSYDISIVSTEPAKNGLSFILEGSSIKKPDSETWKGTCVASGTAGYFRFILKNDTGISSTTFPRLQGTVGTSNADMLVTTTNFVENAVQSIDNAIISIG